MRKGFLFKGVPESLLQDIVLDLDFGILLGGLEPVLSGNLHKGMLFLFDLGRSWSFISSLLDLGLGGRFGGRSSASLDSLGGRHCNKLQLARHVKCEGSIRRVSDASRE